MNKIVETILCHVDLRLPNEESKVYPTYHPRNGKKIPRKIIKNKNYCMIR
jgi:hypothetical protein